MKAKENAESIQAGCSDILEAPTERIINPTYETKETFEDKTISLLEAINEKLSILIKNKTT